MSKRLITALLVLLAIGVQAFAQSAVSGRVTDEAGEPLVGANVLVKGTTTGTMTDYNGNYSLNVRQGAVLVFSSIGYATQEIQVTQGDRLPPNDEQIFMNAYERAKAIEDRIVKYFFWLDIPAVYIPENFGYGKFEFNCAGDNVECFVDDKPMEVVHVDGEDYFAKLTEFGPVMVVCD